MCDSVEFGLHFPDGSSKVVETVLSAEGSSQVFIIFCCPVFDHTAVCVGAWRVFPLHTHVCMYVLFEAAGADGASSSVTFG